MTRREFYQALAVLEREDNPSASQAADAQFQRHTADTWTQHALMEAATLARISRRWEIAMVVVWAVCCFLFVWTPLSKGWPGSLCLLPGYLVSVAARRVGADRLIPLLARLDDRRLTPLWLVALPRATNTLHKVAIRRHLTRHLPDGHLSGEPLPEPAQRALHRLVRQLASLKAKRNAEEDHLLIAALVSLDAMADTKTRASVARLAEQPCEERVTLAAEDAVQRLGAGRNA